MAKKTTRPTTIADAPAPAKPRTRAKSSTAKPRKATASDETVASVAVEATELSVIIQREPTDEEVRERAYHRYLERRGTHGSEFDDWLEARRDLLKGR
ncbi:MAG: DUF2934 domain-containing protein [Vicinamibacterales bacterium]